MLMNNDNTLYDGNGVKPAGIVALAAMDAFMLIDLVRLFPFAADASDRAAPGAERAADAFVRLNFIPQQRGANFRRAFFLMNMRFIFIAEMLHCTHDRIGRGFA